MVRGLVIESYGLVQVRDFAEDQQILKSAVGESVGGHLEMMSGPTWRMYFNGHGIQSGLPVNVFATLLKNRVCHVSARDAIVGTAVVFGVTPDGTEADAPPDITTWAKSLAADELG
jgi:hypothetical protein